MQDSNFFDRSFDGVLAWGLMFLLSPADQRRGTRCLLLNTSKRTRGVAMSFAPRRSLICMGKLIYGFNVSVDM
jgi:hypothetical protein